jgi:hypothetical protein
MLPRNSEGHPTELNHDLIYKIIEAIPEVIVQNQVALRARIPRQRLSDWLKFGERDMLKGDHNSIFAQLADRYHYARTEVLKENIQIIKSCPKNYQAIIWLIERCFREDFGSDSQEIKELREMFKNILALTSKGYADEIDDKSTQENT